MYDKENSIKQPFSWIDFDAQNNQIVFSFLAMTTASIIKIKFLKEKTNIFILVCDVGM